MGKICGRRLIVNGKELNAFEGIPYAKPPLNELRFKKPIPLEPWDKPIKAVKIPNPCYQLNPPKILINSNISEDCLYMSIYAPHLYSTSTVPVMIWFQGTGFEDDSSITTETIPTELVSRANVIFIGINYRLNAFGFLYTATDDAPGNVGIYDQIMGMEFIRDNIEFFGGDPNQVTIFGDCGGGTSVGFHILSPLSRNLFKNAILMSSSPLGHLYIDDKDLLLKAWLKGTEIVGCGNGTYFTIEMIECLKNLDPQKLAEIYTFNEIIEITKSYIFPFAIYGDEFMPQNPILMIMNRNYKNGMSLMTGFTADEKAHTLYYRNPLIYNSEYKLSREETYEQIHFFTDSFKSSHKINASDVSMFYLTGIVENDSDGYHRVISSLYGDFEIICPMIKFSKLMVNQHNRVFQYYITQKPTNNGFTFRDYPQWSGGTGHREDYIYWFGSPFVYPNNFTDYDREISSIAMDVLSHFAYHGAPPPQNGIKWSNFYTINGEVIAPYYEFPSLKKPDGYFGMNIKHAECDILWDPYIYY